MFGPVSGSVCTDSYYKSFCVNLHFHFLCQVEQMNLWTFMLIFFRLRKVSALNIHSKARIRTPNLLTELSQKKPEQTENYISSLLLKFQPPRLKSSIITPSNHWHKFFSDFIISSSDSCDQSRTQYVPLNMTWKNELGYIFRKTVSFRHSQRAQHVAETPISICFLIFAGHPFSQDPNIFVMLTCGIIPKV